MFNEAFWFFYLVDVVTSITVLFAFTAFFAGVGTAATFCIWKFDQKDECRKPAIALGALCMVLLTLAIGLPSERALYAGATQYVAETTDIDDTLIALKRAIDQRLEEITDQ